MNLIVGHDVFLFLYIAHHSTNFPFHQIFIYSQLLRYEQYLTRIDIWAFTHCKKRLYFSFKLYTIELRYNWCFSKLTHRSSKCLRRKRKCQNFSETPGMFSSETVQWWRPISLTNQWPLSNGLRFMFSTFSSGLSDRYFNISRCQH